MISASIMKGLIALALIFMYLKNRKQSVQIKSTRSSFERPFVNLGIGTSTLELGLEMELELELKLQTPLFPVS